MEEDEDVFMPDFICERGELLRGIAADLDVRKSKASRDILRQAADRVLEHMDRPKARVIALIPNGEKAVAGGDNDA